jgi:hypothetical protein
VNTKVASAEVIDQSRRGYGYVPILLVELTASVQDVRDSGTAGLSRLRSEKPSQSPASYDWFLPLPVHRIRPKFGPPASFFAMLCR